MVQKSTHKYLKARKHRSRSPPPNDASVLSLGSIFIFIFVSIALSQHHDRIVTYLVLSSTISPFLHRHFFLTTPSKLGSGEIKQRNKSDFKQQRQHQIRGNQTRRIPIPIPIPIPGSRPRCFISSIGTRQTR